MSNTKGSKPSKTGRPIGCLFPVIGFAALMVIGFVSTLITQPGTFAGKNQCRGPANAEPAYANTCKHDVNTRVCMRRITTDADAERICDTVLLKPGEGIASDRYVAAEASGLFHVEAYTCKAPYLPGEVRDKNTHRLKAGCVKPGAKIPSEASGN